MKDPAFRDRTDAGRRLADGLRDYAGRDDVLVLALPRGGVPVGLEVARALGAPLDVFLVRKLEVPGHETLAMGAVASGGVRVLNEDAIRELGLTDEDIARSAADAQQDMERRERAYRGQRKEPELEGLTVVLVDDGLATGSTMRAAVAALRARDPARLVVAVPVADSEACAAFRDEVDDVVCTMTPDPFHTVGAWYESFEPLTDDQVRALLETADAPA